MKLCANRLATYATPPGHARKNWLRVLTYLSLTGVLAVQLLTFLRTAPANPADPADWPHFLGPNRDGVYHGPPVDDSWADGGVPVVWSRPVGRGFSGPVVARDKLILFHRLGDREVVECLDANTGDRHWSFQYPAAYHDDFGFDNGPRSTPAISGQRVYTFGADGKLSCLDLDTGKKIWGVDTHRRFQVQKGFFGAASSPLVDGYRVLLNVGGRDSTGLVAFDRENGDVLWTASSDQASYSSPTLATIDGDHQALFFTRNGLIGVDPETGSVLFQFGWRARMQASVNAATPLVIGNLVFLSASYRIGAVLLRIRGTDLAKVWSSDDVLSNHYATSVYWQGHLYGFHGRQEYGPSFRCIELRTGKIRWSKDRLGAGTVTRVGNRLLVLTENGELSLVATDAQVFRRLASWPILTATVRAYPAVARGRVYARNRDTLVCIDLPERTGRPTPRQLE